MLLYLGKNGINKELTEVYLGNLGVNKKQKEIYLGKGGFNKQIYKLGNVSIITLNSSDFTILKRTNSGDFTIDVYGLDASYNWLNLTQADKDAIQWTIDSGNSAQFKVGGVTSTTDTGSPVTITMTGNVGTTTVRAHLAGLTGWDSGDVTANIVVERTSGTVAYVNYIDITVDFSQYDAIHSTSYGVVNKIGQTVLLNEAGMSIFPDVLKMDPSATSTIATMKRLGIIAGFTTDAEGGYVNTITPTGSTTAIGYDATLFKGWQYEVYDAQSTLLTQYRNMSPSIVPLENGYIVKWIWK